MRVPGSVGHELDVQKRVEFAIHWDTHVEEQSGTHEGKGNKKRWNSDTERLIMCIVILDLDAKIP